MGKKKGGKMSKEVRNPIKVWSLVIVLILSMVIPVISMSADGNESLDEGEEVSVSQTEGKAKARLVSMNGNTDELDYVEDHISSDYVSTQYTEAGDYDLSEASSRIGRGEDHHQDIFHITADGYNGTDISKLVTAEGEILGPELGPEPINPSIPARFAFLNVDYSAAGESEWHCFSLDSDEYKEYLEVPAAESWHYPDDELITRFEKEGYELDEEARIYDYLDSSNKAIIKDNPNGPDRIKEERDKLKIYNEIGGIVTGLPGEHTVELHDLVEAYQFMAGPYATFGWTGEQTDDIKVAFADEFYKQAMDKDKKYDVVTAAEKATENTEVEEEDWEIRYNHNYGINQVYLWRGGSLFSLDNRPCHDGHDSIGNCSDCWTDLVKNGFEDKGYDIDPDSELSGFETTMFGDGWFIEDFFIEDGDESEFYNVYWNPWGTQDLEIAFDPPTRPSCTDEVSLSATFDNDDDSVPEEDMVYYEIRLEPSNNGTSHTWGPGEITYKQYNGYSKLQTDINLQELRVPPGYYYWVVEVHTAEEMATQESSLTTITGEFTELETSIDGQGSVLLNGEEIDNGELSEFGCDSDGEGQLAQLKAVPAENYIFEGWSGAFQSDEGEITLEMDQSKDVTAHFGLPEFTVNIEGEGTVKVDGQEVSSGWSKEYESGTEVLLEVDPASGYKFEYWYGDGIKTVEDNEFRITIYTDRELTAKFVEKDDSGGGGYPTPPDGPILI